MPTMRERIAALEAERSEVIDHNWALQETVDELRRECDNLQTTVAEDMRYLREADTWRDRASAAEQDLSFLRAGIRMTVESLRDVTKGGPVAYRHVIASHLEKILSV